MRIGQLLPIIWLLAGSVATAQDTVIVSPPAITSQKGMVLCSSDLACDVGAKVLAK
jgi:hypothetical protein